MGDALWRMVNAALAVIELELVWRTTFTPEGASSRFVIDRLDRSTH